MTSSIGGSGNIPLPPSATLSHAQPAQPVSDLDQNVPALAKQMQDQMGQFSEQLNNLFCNQSQASNVNFLQDMANTVRALKDTVEKALNLRKL